MTLLRPNFLNFPSVFGKNVSNTKLALSSGVGVHIREILYWLLIDVLGSVLLFLKTKNHLGYKNFIKDLSTEDFFILF